MGYNDHIGDAPEETVKCPKCGKRFICWEEDQMPGFRDRDTLRCPYCREEIASSMEVEFHVRKLEE